MLAGPASAPQRLAHSQEAHAVGVPELTLVYQEVLEGQRVLRGRAQGGIEARLWNSPLLPQEVIERSVAAGRQGHSPLTAVDSRTRPVK